MDNNYIMVAIDDWSLVKSPMKIKELSNHMEHCLLDAGVVDMHYDPRTMRRLYRVQEMPKDIPEAGIYWKVVDSL